MFFWAPPRKSMQNHQEITSKPKFWTRNVRNWIKSCDLASRRLPQRANKPGYRIQGSGNPRKTCIFIKLCVIFWSLKYFWFFVKYWSFWLNKYVFFSFSKQSHAESSRNFINKLVLDPKCGNGRKTQGNICLFSKCIFTKNYIISLQTIGFDGFNMLMSFLAEK